MLYGERSALAAAILWTFHPLILAHAGLVTADSGALAMTIISGWAFCSLDRHYSLGMVLCSGITLGLAIGVKFTLLPMVVSYPALYCLRNSRTRNAERTSHRVRTFIVSVVVVLLASHVVNTLYFYQGVGVSVTDLSPSSATMRTAKATILSLLNKTGVQTLPCPLPLAYIEGIDLQIRDAERIDRCYMNGIWYDRGQWYYYLYGCAIKSPIGYWVVFALALATFPRHRSQGGEIYLIAPAIVVILVLSWNTGLMHHVRYALPAVGLSIVFTSRVFANGLRLVPTFRVGWVALIGISMLQSAIASLIAAPYFISYYTSAARLISASPPLLHSDLDWGQGLTASEKWLSARRAGQPVYLSYMGMYDPEHLGFDYRPPELIQNGIGDKTLPSGWHVASINLIEGQKHSCPDGRGGTCAYSGEYFALLKVREPLAVVGGCMYVYLVP